MGAADFRMDPIAVAPIADGRTTGDRFLLRTVASPPNKP